MSNFNFADLLSWCPGAESNCRHEDFQSSALPTELPRRTAKEGVLNRILNFESSLFSSFFRIHLIMLLNQLDN